MPRCLQPLELWFQLSTLESCMAKLNRKKLTKLVQRIEALSSYISLGQGDETRKYQSQGGRKQNVPLQAAKVRTKMSAKPGSRRCRAVALSGHCLWEIWKQQEMKSIKYSSLTQSHASLPTTTRTSISTLHIRKLHGQIEQEFAKPIHRAEALSS